MSITSTRKTMMKYFDAEHGDVSMMADDIVFTMMSTGEETVGPEAVLQMLTYFYHTAFDARAEARNLIFSEDRAVYEGHFIGKHIGEFAGIPATNKSINMPFTVVYDLENEQIKRARIYFEIAALISQLSGSPN